MTASMLLAATSASADPVTVASFADPGGSKFMSYTTDGTNAGTTFTGGYDLLGLIFNIIEPIAASYPNATFTFPTLTATAFLEPIPGATLTRFNGGQIDFFDALLNPIFHIVFGAATLTDPGGSIGGSVLALQGVNLFLPSGDPYFDPQDFSFTLIGPEPGVAGGPSTVSGARALALSSGTPQSLSWGSSFNASADLTQVPEPGSMFLLGTGLVGLATSVRRRRQNV